MNASSPNKQFVRVPKTAELVATNLRRRIIHGELKEGDNLPPESILIEEFGVSRPTMREAFRILETERLISVSRGSRGGAKVHLPHVDVVARYAGHYLQARNTTLADVFQARLAMEPMAARMFAARKSKDAIARLTDIVDQIEARIDEAEAYAHLGAEVHLAVIEGSGNETMTLVGHLLHLIWDAHLINATGRRYDKKLAEKGLRSYRKLLALLSAGDEQGAETHMRAHLESTGNILLKHYGAKSIIDLMP